MLALEPFLRSYTTAIEAYTAMLSILYDIATNQLERHKKIIVITNNFIFLKIRLDSKHKIILLKTYTHITLWLTRFHTYKKYLTECCKYLGIL